MNKPPDQNPQQRKRPVMTTAAEAREAFRQTLNPPESQDWKSDCIFQDAIETVQDYINDTEARISELVEQNDSLKRRLSMAWERGEFALLNERDALKALLKEAGEALAPLAQQITNLGDCVEGCMKVQDDVTIKMLTSSTSIRKAAAIADKIKEQIK